MKKLILFLAILIAVPSATFTVDAKRTTTTRTKVTTKNRSNSKKGTAPSWIQGDWRGVLNTPWGSRDIRVSINGKRIVVRANGELQCSGTYTFSGDKIFYTDIYDTSVYILLDFANERLKIDSNTPMYRY